MRLTDAECDALMETIGRREFKTRDDIQEWLDNAPTLYGYVDFVNKIEELKCRIPKTLYDKVPKNSSKINVVAFGFIDLNASMKWQMFGKKLMEKNLFWCRDILNVGRKMIV